jgi:hypothetical protein
VDKRLIRLAYAIEYPIALIAFFTLWSQAAGQGHLDLIYWYWKAAIGLAAALACVKATQSVFEGERAWTGRTVGWLSVVAALMLVAGLVTYYAHIYYEEQDSDEEDQPAVTMTSNRVIKPASHPTSGRPRSIIRNCEARGIPTRAVSSSHGMNVTVPPVSRARKATSRMSGDTYRP